MAVPQAQTRCSQRGRAAPAGAGGALRPAASCPPPGRHRCRESARQTCRCVTTRGERQRALSWGALARSPRDLAGAGAKLSLGPDTAAGLPALPHGSRRSGAAPAPEEVRRCPRGAPVSQTCLSLACPAAHLYLPEPGCSARCGSDTPGCGAGLGRADSGDSFFSWLCHSYVCDLKSGFLCATASFISMCSKSAPLLGSVRCLELASVPPALGTS